MPNKIVLKKSSVATKTPLDTDLDYGELAINYTDEKLYFKNASNVIKSFGQGTVTSVSTGTGLTGGPITTTGTIALANTAVTAGSYTLSNITVDAQGRITAASSGTAGGSALAISNKTAAYTVVAGDLGTIINCTSGTFTVSLTAAATLGAGFNVWIWNTSATLANVITIDPNGAETIDGRATLILRRGEGMQIVCDGTNWQTGDKKTMRGYAENIVSTAIRPTVSGDGSVAIGVDAQATGTASASFGQGAIASANFSLSLGLNTVASGERSVGIGNNGVIAGSSFSTAIGHNSGFGGSTTATGSGAMALGGSYTSGIDSFAAAVADNTSSYGAQGNNSIAIGYRARVASSSSNAIAIGASSVASGGSALAIALAGTGWGTQATARNTIAIGDGARSSIQGKYVLANGCSSSAAGDMQTGTMILGGYTTDATPYVMRSYTYAVASATNQVILPNNSAYAFSGIIVARRQAAGGTQSAAWEVKGLIRREGTAASTVLVNSALTIIDNTPGWTLALSADTTNGGLAVTFTGAAATNIRAVATIQTSEVTYA